MAATTVPFSGVDGVMRALDEPRRPQTIELEVAVVGTIDEIRLREAVRTAASRHPMARARQLPARPFDLNDSWVIDDAPIGDPVAVATATTRSEVDALRDAFVSRHIDLEAGPPFRFLLVHEPDGDRVLLSVN
ncbi:MAG: hypothetical protein M3Q68_09075, partial [Actinomycetota bacterium]|nr:hypothetical protein [Actinomycetota bacterium]